MAASGSSSSSPSSSIMNVVFETEDKNSFRMKIAPSDTIFEVKAKILRTTGTRMFHQVLIFQDRVLDKSSTVESCSITPNSRIQLRIEDPFPGLPVPSTIVELVLCVPKYPGPYLCLSMRPSNTILQLKQTLRQQVSDLPPLDRLGVYMYRKRHELQDAKTLNDYGLIGVSVLDVFIKPVLTPFPRSEPKPKKGNIQVLTSCGKRLHLQVDPDDKVLVLRDVLKKLQQIEKFELSSNYFFIHNSNVLDDNASFGGNYIGKDDEIEIVHGSIHVLLNLLMESSEPHIPTCRFFPLLKK